MANGDTNGNRISVDRITTRLAFGSVSLLVLLFLAWAGWIQSSFQEHRNQLIHRGAADRIVVDVMKANQESLARELAINRTLLNRIDKNTGGEGDAPPVASLMPVPPRRVD